MNVCTVELHPDGVDRVSAFLQGPLRKEAIGGEDVTDCTCFSALQEAIIRTMLALQSRSLYDMYCSVTKGILRLYR